MVTKLKYLSLLVVLMVMVTNDNHDPILELVWWEMSS